MSIPSKYSLAKSCNQTGFLHFYLVGREGGQMERGNVGGASSQVSGA